MTGLGGGKSSKSGGSKSKGKSSKGDALHKKVSIQTEKHHLSTLRNALRDELGGDRDVLSAFGAFTKIDRDGMALDVHFRTGSTISDEELDWAEDLVHRNLHELDQGWSPQALMDDMCYPSSRFALVTERAPACKSKKAPKTGKPVAFAHFRFTVEGDTRDEMAGLPVLLLRDLQVEPDWQKNGLGKHLCQLLELAARKNAMHGLMMFVPAGEPGTIARAFVSSKLRGFTCVDEVWPMSDPNLSVFAKSLVKKLEPATPATPKTVPEAAPSPDSVLARPRLETKEVAKEVSTEAADTEKAHANETEQDTTKEPLAETARPAAPSSLFAAFAAPGVSGIETVTRKMSFADFGTAAPDEDVSSSEDEEDVADEFEKEATEEATDEEANDILGQLVDLFKEKNGRGGWAVGANVEGSGGGWTADVTDGWSIDVTETRINDR